MNHVFSAVKAIIQKGDKFLVIKQELTHATVWDLPGGKVDFGESPYDTLAREVKEELRLTVNILKPIGMFWFFRQDGDQVVCTAFLCTANGEIDLTKNPSTEKITEFKWVTKAEFLSDEYPVGHNSIKQVISTL